jgi:uncharacterized membrane protein
MSQKSSGSQVYNIVAFVFNGEQRAHEVASELKLDASELGMKVISTSIVTVDAKGKTKVHETGHGGRGTAIGAAAGGLLGLIGGPAGLLAWAVGGAVVGGVAGKHFGKAIPEEDLKALGQHMMPNTSAVLMLLEDQYAESVIDSMQGYGAKVVTLTVADQVSGAIAMAVAADTGEPKGSAADDQPAADQSADQAAASKESAQTKA